jgi:hypothetical protein
MSDYRTSLLVNRQVPEFIREEHPLFISFLEAYYEFLENKQDGENNDLTNRAKNLRDLSDVDVSIDDFEDAFFNMYASLMPRDVAVDKTTLIKHVLPLYLSKGSEKSFKLLFRMMFGSELNVTYPRSEVLRASDGKWVIEKYVKVDDTAFSLHYGDGTKTEFTISQGASLHVDGDVYINNVLQTSGYYFRSEISKLFFLTPPANGAEIRVEYDVFSYEQVINRKLIGQNSGATALVERIGTQIINNAPVHEFYLDEKSLYREFSIGEIIRCDVIGVDDSIVSLYFRGLSSVLNVNIIDGGSNYSVGNPVIINAPGSTAVPKAVISKVFSGSINTITINDGGAGFQAPDLIDADGYTSDELQLAIASVREERANSVSNTFFIYSDIISDVDPANTLISATDWNFPGNTNFGSTNVNTTIVRAFSNTAYTLIGAIANVSILANSVVTSTSPVFHARPAKIVLDGRTANTSAQSTVQITSYGSIGKLHVVWTGLDYSVGDQLVFTNPKGQMALGIGAEAEISNVSTLGAINEVTLLPPKITGTANVWSLSNTRIEGNNTTFLTDLAVGDLIIINSSNTRVAKYETRKVINISSNTSLNVNSAFTGSFVNDRTIRKVGKYPVGGANYKATALPTVTIVSANGNSGLIEVASLLGAGENLTGTGTKRPGEIEQIQIIEPGAGITIIPQVDLTQSGDGTALANVSLSPTFDSLQGRWTSSDGILSSDRKIQGRNFYGNFAYLTTSQVEFSKYKKIFKDLLHPAGFKAYAEWERKTDLEQQPVSLDIVTVPKNIRTLSGLVNVANASITVTGVGTRFNVANTLGIITIGSYIAVNSDIRMINAIISNTELTVSESFTVTANLEEMVVVNTVYDAVATEITLEEITAENEIVLTVES